MDEIKVVLQRHGKLNRSGMSLLRKHAGIRSPGVAVKDLRKKTGISNDDVARLFPDQYSLFLRPLLVQGYAVLSNAIDSRIADRLIANYDRNIGYDPRSSTIRRDIGIGMRKTLVKIGLYRLPKLMEGLYEITRPAAQILARRLDLPVSYPRKYADFQKRCEAVGQKDPVVVFQYKCGSYVRFHSDPVNKIPFPFQFLGLLSDHNSFSGGDFLLRRYVKGTSSVIRLRLRKGDILIFPVGSFKRSRSGQVENWQHAVAKLKRSKRFSISFLLNQAFV